MVENKGISDAVPDKKQTQKKKQKPIQHPLVLEVKATLVLPDGKHKGVITNVSHRTDPFGYIDMTVKVAKTEGELRFGYPDTITERTGLGKFLDQMGIKLVVGKQVDLGHELLGRQISFTSENEETEKGVFARIIAETVKPLD